MAGSYETTRYGYVGGRVQDLVVMGRPRKRWFEMVKEYMKKVGVSLEDTRQEHLETKNNSHRPQLMGQGKEQEKFEPPANTNKPCQSLEVTATLHRHLKAQDQYQCTITYKCTYCLVGYCNILSIFCLYWRLFLACI